MRIKNRNTALAVAATALSLSAITAGTAFASPAPTPVPTVSAPASQPSASPQGRAKVPGTAMPLSKQSASEQKSTDKAAPPLYSDGVDEPVYYHFGDLGDACDADNLEYQGYVIPAPAVDKNHRQVVYGGVAKYYDTKDVNKFCVSGLMTNLVDFNGMEFTASVYDETKKKTLKGSETDTIMDESGGELGAVIDGSATIRLPKDGHRYSFVLRTHNPRTDGTVKVPLRW